MYVCAHPTSDIDAPDSLFAFARRKRQTRQQALRGQAVCRSCPVLQPGHQHERVQSCFVRQQEVSASLDTKHQATYSSSTYCTYTAVGSCGPLPDNYYDTVVSRPSRSIMPIGAREYYAKSYDVYLQQRRARWSWRLASGCRRRANKY